MRWPAGQLFSSLLCSARFLYPSPYGGGAGSSSTFSSSVFYCGGARCFAPGKDGDLVPEGFSRNELSTHFAHNQLTRLQQGRSGASLVSFSLPCPQNRTQGCTGPSFGFLSRTSFPLPPKGGGAGYHLTWLAGILMQRSPVLFRRKRRILRIRGLL